MSSKKDVYQSSVDPENKLSCPFCVCGGYDGEVVGMAGDERLGAGDLRCMLFFLDSVDVGLLLDSD